MRCALCLGIVFMAACASPSSLEIEMHIDEIELAQQKPQTHSSEKQQSSEYVALQQLSPLQQQQALKHVAADDRLQFQRLLMECFASDDESMHLLALTHVLDNGVNANGSSAYVDKQLVDSFFVFIENGNQSVQVQRRSCHVLQQFAYLHASNIVLAQLHTWRTRAQAALIDYLQSDALDLQREAVRALQTFQNWDLYPQLIDEWTKHPDSVLAEDIKKCLSLWMRIRAGKGPGAQSAVDNLLLELADDPLKWQQHLIAHVAIAKTASVKSSATHFSNKNNPQLAVAVDVTDVKQAVQSEAEQDAMLISVKQKMTNKQDYIFYGQARFHRKHRRVELDAWIGMDQGVIEYALVPHYGKIHESLLVTRAHPMSIQTVCLLLGATAGDRIAMDIRWEDSDGVVHQAPINTFIKHANEVLTEHYVFQGSRFTRDPQTQSEHFAAAKEGVVVSLQSDEGAIIASSHQQRDDYSIIGSLPFKRGQAVELVIYQVEQ